MNTARLRKLLLALSLLWLSSLACQTLTEPEEIFGESPTIPIKSSAPTPQPEQQAAEPTAANPLQNPRLTSANLPSLTFGPVGPSPSAPNRVSLSGSPQSLDTAHFRIHYTLSGKDAVDPSDSDNNGHPDYVQEVATAVEYAWYAEIDYFGWPAPPPDQGFGGNDLFDVYLEDIFEDGTAGYVDGGYEETIIGDNPNTPGVESAASFSFMSIDNDYNDFEDFAANGVTILQYMRSTVAHEFMHAIQYGYDSFEPHDWLWEASSNWIQDEVLDDYNDLIEDAYAVFNSPDSCQLAYGGEGRWEDENHWYGLWLFVRFYSERYGHDAVRELWEGSVTADGYQIWETALAERGSNLNQLFSDYSVALLLRQFEEGYLYPTLRLQGEARLNELYTPQDGVGQLGADYIHIAAHEPVTILLDGAGLQGIAVGLDSNANAHLYPLSNGRAEVNAAEYNQLYLIVMNPNQASNEDACQFSDYSVSLQSGANPIAPSAIIAAHNFEAPTVQALTQNADSVPEYLDFIYVPDGYEFADYYEQTRDEFYYPEFIDYYIPGPGPVTVLDYHIPGEEDYLRLFESESPFFALDDFIVWMGDFPTDEEMVVIAGLDVLVEDYTEDQYPFSYATFILGDYFYVIEGSISTDEMTQVVSSWLLGE